ncbi:MAG: hypothetical protein Q9207_004234 [Kuettlingeria erythrocarpa]
MSYPLFYQTTTMSFSQLSAPYQSPTTSTHTHPHPSQRIHLHPTHPLANHAHTCPPVRKTRKESYRVSKRAAVAKPTTHSRKEPSLLKSTLTHNGQQLASAIAAAADDKSQLLGGGGTPSSPYTKQMVRENQRPQREAPPPSNIRDANSGDDGIEWNRWIDFDMCGMDSMAEKGYIGAAAAPPLRDMVVVRPVEFRGNYCGVVVGC